MTGLVKSEEIFQITQKMFDDLEYDAGSSRYPITSTSGNKLLGMFVFNQSDLNSAAYYLEQSLQDPLNPGAIKCAFVQESCSDRFKEILKTLLRRYSIEALENKALTDALIRSNNVLATLSLKTSAANSPTVVFDFPQEHFTAGGPSTVVTFYTFRTVKEAIALCKKETSLGGASIWCENHAMGLEVVAGTSLSDYYLNCCNVGWNPIADYIANRQTFAKIENSYHYETLAIEGAQKNIVFPFGTTFAN